VLVGQRLVEWNFSAGDAGWGSFHQCVQTAQKGALSLTCQGEDPNLFSPRINVKGPIVVQLRMRAQTAGAGEIFWVTKESPQWSGGNSCQFALKHDGQWHDYQALIEAKETITQLRLDPGSAPGPIEIQWIRLCSGRRHPIEVHSIQSDERGVTVGLINHDTGPLECRVNTFSVTLKPGVEKKVTISATAKEPFELVPAVIRGEGLPAIELPICLYRPEASAEWITRQTGGLTTEIAFDGSGARFLLKDRVVAVLAPLVRVGMTVPKMRRIGDASAAIRFEGDGVTVSFEPTAEGAGISIQSRQPAEGPALRALGPLEQGIFAGIEYLGKGEHSSSKLDIETEAHWRITPNSLKVTMPLMACVTDQVSAAMLWKEMSLQPVYATPNFLDGTSDSRMALRGKTIDATLLIRPPAPMSETVLWAVKQRGLPPLPKPPRSDSAQKQLMLQAFTHSVAGEGGWGHAAEARWKRYPYADIVSAIGRLSGQWLKMPKLVSGGSHIRNDAAYFLTGNAAQWRQLRRSEARSILAQQQPDGSFRYKGPYQRGHFENTASGYNAWRAVLLLEYARLSGDQKALAGGLKSLDYMKRFRTPRGAQTYELSLHTPDLLAAAYLTWSYVRGYELTGQADYLHEARKWALSGVPFIYQWSRLPVMSYATIPVLGASQWKEPDWIGLPVQWCGAIYGYSLAMLAHHDHSLDWPYLARGILITAQQMQYPDGKVAGCLPDFYMLAEQRRGGPSLNPGVLLSLRRALDRKADSLAVATDGGHRVISPFPVSIKGNIARIQAAAGLHYQIIADGKIMDIVSHGMDEIPLEGK
jgi:hypothetical protein